jgi:hypothetical protein
MASRRRIETDLQRPLPKSGERTGRHKCVLCLKEIPVEEFLKNDFLCDECAAKDEYPLASTPEEG